MIICSVTLHKIVRIDEALVHKLFEKTKRTKKGVLKVLHPISDINN